MIQMNVHPARPDRGDVPATGGYYRSTNTPDNPDGPRLYMAECGEAGCWSFAVDLPDMPAIDQFIAHGWQIQEGRIRCPEHAEREVPA